MKLNYTILASLLLVTSSAAAQPGGGAPLPPPPPPEAPPPIGIDAAVMEDANSGRTWLAPTALQNPAGTFAFHDWMLLLAGVSYSPTDKVQLSASTIIPITTDMPIIAFLTGKVQVINVGQLRVAGHATLNYIRVTDDIDDASLTTATLGGAATYCLDQGCHTLLNGFVAGGFSLDYADEQTAVPFVASAAVVFRASRHVKLVLEADTGFVLGEVDAFADGVLGCAGVRFTSRKIGVDLGLIRPFPCDDCGNLIAVPMASFTYRSL